MRYHDFHGIQIPLVGIRCGGLMKHPADAEDLIRTALREGSIYMDLSEQYGEGNAAPLLGGILENYPREQVYLANGFPGYRMQDFGRQEEIFEAQLNDLKTDHIDFYLLKNVTEFNVDRYLDPDCGVVEYLIGQKEKGRIRFLGASFLGNIDPMRRFLDRYAAELDFCQFSLNWMDWDFHAAKQKVRLCRKWDLPIWAEDPLKGNLLELLNEERFDDRRQAASWEDVSEILCKLKISAPEERIDLACRFIQSVPEVKLSLMEADDPERLISVVRRMETENPLDEMERKTLAQLANMLPPKKTLPCTGCRMCMKHCIKFLDIAGFIDLYNEELLMGPQRNTPMYVKAYPVEKQPQSCCHWGPCQSVCPQKLDIIHTLLPFSTKVRRSPFAE